MRVIVWCTSIARDATIRYGDGGPVCEERAAVTLEPVHSTDPQHPNRAVWPRGLAMGQIRLAELPPEAAAGFALHALYELEIREWGKGSGDP